MYLDIRLTPFGAGGWRQEEASLFFLILSLSTLGTNGGWSDRSQEAPNPRCFSLCFSSLETKRVAGYFGRKKPAQSDRLLRPRANPPGAPRKFEGRAPTLAPKKPRRSRGAEAKTPTRWASWRHNRRHPRRLSTAPVR